MFNFINFKWKTTANVTTGVQTFEYSMYRVYRILSKSDHKLMWDFTLCIVRIPFHYTSCCITNVEIQTF